MSAPGEAIAVDRPGMAGATIELDRMITGTDGSNDRTHPVRITFRGAVGEPLHGPMASASPIHLHLRIVARVADAGIVLSGWLSDPLDLVDRLTVGVGTNDPIDLMALAVISTAADRHDVFDAPPGIPVSFGFVAFVAGLAGHADATLTVHLRDGAACVATLAETGNLTLLNDLLDRAPLSYSLPVVAHLIGSHRVATGRHEPMPAAICDLAERAFARIDPLFEYGKGRGGHVLEAYVDASTRVGALGILIKGWMLKDHSVSVTDMAIVSLSGRRQPVPVPLAIVARPDVVAARAGQFATRNPNCGFVSYVPVDDLDPDDRFWFIEIALADGSIRRTPFLCGLEPAPLQGIRTAVALAEANALDLDDLFRRAIAPSLAWFWSQAKRDRPVPTELTYGQPPLDAAVSIIVPLYGRIDFVRHQLASFSNDPDFRTIGGMVELIYVLDDPEAERELKRLCRLQHDIYGISFRTVLLNGNFGYSRANNAGARVATGRLLVLLNSDVVPKRSRWVEQLTKRYTTLDGCGILGCRLLLEDGSIQHAGMSFRPSPFVAGAWCNDHRGKGLPVTFDPCTEPTEVAAVTGACLMIDRTLFLDVGGLSEDYVIGDFEDSDLCLKVHERGLKVYYTPDVELYHLERQSMQLIGDGHVGWRQSLTLFNMWQHAQRWKSLIPQISKRYARLGDDDWGQDPVPVNLMPDPPRVSAPAPAVNAEAGGRSRREISPELLAAISPEPFVARLRALADHDPATRVLSWVLGPDGLLEWGHCIGMLDDPALAATLPALPPAELRAITAAVEEQTFLWTGLFDTQLFLGLFDRHTQMPRNGKLRVLDFGCGCGRLTRFLDQHAGIEAFASDINPDLTQWCRDALSRTQVALNSAAPPVPFEDEAFDLVVSLSVFTHLSRDQSRAWLAELARTLVPGGLMIVTTHGYPALNTIGGSPIHQDMFRIDTAAVQSLIARLPHEGSIFLPYEADILSAARAGEDYGNTFTDPDHIRSDWVSEMLQFVEHVPGGLRGWQDVVVLRRV